jgi:hypothetical protein
MFLIFHGPMKNGYGATAIEYTAINLDHFRSRHWRDEQLQPRKRSRAEQVGPAELDGVSDCRASVVHAEAALSNRPAIARLFCWAASLLRFRGKL